jgi:hypothetical protein
MSWRTAARSSPASGMMPPTCSTAARNALATLAGALDAAWTRRFRRWRPTAPVTYRRAGRSRRARPRRVVGLLGVLLRARPRRVAIACGGGVEPGSEIALRLGWRRRVEDVEPLRLAQQDTR